MPYGRLSETAHTALPGDTAELQVSVGGLQAQAGWCESLGLHLPVDQVGELTSFIHINPASTIAYRY